MKKVKTLHRLNESPVKINEYQAIEIAKRFLEQHHSVSGAKAVLNGKEWIITTSIGISKNNVRIVRIDAKTGKILDYT